MASQDKWFTPHIRYGADLGYVMLQLSHIDLPAFSYENTAYESKQELHCSLLCTRKLAVAFPDPEAADSSIAAFVGGFVNEHAVELEGFTDKVYVCEEGDSKTIIIEVRVKGVAELYRALRTEFPQLSQLPDPVLHVTLYKYNHQFGIGIQNEEQLRAMCQQIPFEQLPLQLQEQL